MAIDFDGMALFVRIAEHKSISAAARVLGLQKSTLSRRLAALEASLGLPLIRRSSRSLTLTDAGQTYYARAAPLIAEAAAIENEIRATTGALAGLARLTATVGFGQTVLTPLLCEFLKSHPRVRLDLRFTDRRVNLIDEGFDMAVRMGSLEDSELIARRLCTVARVVCASPDYLSGRAAPTLPDDLHAHDCIVVAPELDHWQFDTDSAVAGVRVPWRVASGNIETARLAALGGIGVALLPRFLVAGDLVSGRLVALLPHATPLPVQATALTPRARTASPLLCALLEHLASKLRGQTI